MKAALKVLGLAILLVLTPALARQADAIPVLQLDLAGGVFDPVSETVVAPGGAFTLYALLTPKENATQAQIDALLNTTYYVAVALVPKTTPPGGSYGSFAFGLPGSTALNCTETTSPTPGSCPETVNVTSDMTYGVPPLEQMIGLQGWDSNDLSQHGIYETYFSEFSFKFSATSTTAGYNVQDDPGGPSTGTGAYYASFVGDSSLLQAGYQLHFDLYDTVLKSCSKDGTCTDVDRDRFAPFSHDAETGTTRVPEPASAVLMLAGLTICGWRRRTA